MWPHQTILALVQCLPSSTWAAQISSRSCRLSAFSLITKRIIFSSFSTYWGWWRLSRSTILITCTRSRSCRRQERRGHYGEQKAESRKQRAESREQRAETWFQRPDPRSDLCEDGSVLGHDVRVLVSSHCGTTLRGSLPETAMTSHGYDSIGLKGSSTKKNVIFHLKGLDTLWLGPHLE